MNIEKKQGCGLAQLQALYERRKHTLVLAEVAEFIEPLRLPCHWCGTLIRASDIRHYDHLAGFPVAGFRSKQWVYFECSGCEYPLWKQFENKPLNNKKEIVNG